MQKFLGAAFFLIVITSVVEAAYNAKSDTGTEYFDYIENRRREVRENELTEEQKKLLADIDKALEQLPHDIKADEPVPAIFEGDDLIYYSNSGEFIANGKVDILQLEGYRFQSDEITGNTKEQVVYIDGKAHILQLKSGAPRVTLDGYKTVYNYGSKTGTMEEAKGKFGEYYLTGKRFEFYPDHIIVHDGTQTKCGAKIPDYHLSAERLEIWPEQVIRMYNVKFWIKNTLVAVKAYEERKIGESEKNYFPHIGYNSDHGVYVRDNFEIPLRKNLNLNINAYIETKKGIRSNTELQYSNRNLKTTLRYGFYDDSNDRWIQKEPSLDIYYGRHFEELPLSYGLRAEYGHYRQEAVASSHQEYQLLLTHDPISLGSYTLFLNTGYKITNDNMKNISKTGRTIVNGLNYNILIGRDFNDKFAAYAGYFYTKNTSKDSIFNFDLEDYSKKFQMGASYWVTPRDRFVLGLKFNADDHKFEDIDYYWYHDLHCSQVVLRWRDKRDKLELHWEFVPW